MVEKRHNDDVILEKIGNIGDDIVDIKAGIKYQNGRVRTLEKWKSFITGGLAIISILLVPILLILIGQYMEQSKKGIDPAELSKLVETIVESKYNTQ